MVWFLLLVGLILLTIGGELLVRAASRLAISFGIAPLVVGLTVVAFGTSSPELLVSVSSALKGSSDIALGNVVGSNMCNILLILGVSALIAPLIVHQQLLRLDIPVMIGVSGLSLLVSLDGVVSRVDGVLLVVLLIAYVAFLVRTARNEKDSRLAAENEGASGFVDRLLRSRGGQVAGLVAGLGVLTGGAEVFVGAAIELARLFGMSELVIGLTVVAVGTSLPEIVTSVIATIRGERDIAIGNVVGSNIFNILSVLGITSIVSPIAVSGAALTFDLPAMIAVSFACFPLFYVGMKIDRWKGALFLGYYLIYVTYLVLDSSGHSSAPIVSEVMLLGISPIVGVTILALAYREFRSA